MVCGVYQWSIWVKKSLKMPLEKKKTKEEKKRAWCKVWIKNMQTKNSDLNGIEFEVVLSNVNNLN